MRHPEIAQHVRGTKIHDALSEAFLDRHFEELGCDFDSSTPDVYSSHTVWLKVEQDLLMGSCPESNHFEVRLKKGDFILCDKFGNVYVKQNKDGTSTMIRP